MEWLCWNVSTNDRSREAGMSWWQGERQGIRDELLGMVGCCKVQCRELHFPATSKGICRLKVKCVFRSAFEFEAKLISILKVPAQNCKAK